MKARRTTRALLLVCWAVMGAGFRSPPIGARRHGAVALAACDSEAHRDGLARATQVAQPTRRTLLRWLSFAAGGAASAADPAGAAPYPVQKTDAEWAELLSDQQRFVLRDGGTEAPNSSPLVLERRPGEYQCAGCGAGLFASAVKFEARTGWPSFAEAKQVEVAKVAQFMETISGAECRCASCGCRIGERFLDGSSFPGTPAARTGKRYSANGAALVFAPADGGDTVLGEAAGSFVKRRKFDWKMRDGGLRSI
eukprot:Tamp_21579.p1 GENE.Tamp_21579~~Tamp_21579.p1  ORF type:complete len:271 (+),score=33.15 Tamp_21579:57-815(+)